MFENICPLSESIRPQLLLSYVVSCKAAGLIFNNTVCSIHPFPSTWKTCVAVPTWHVVSPMTPCVD